MMDLFKLCEQCDGHGYVVPLNSPGHLPEPEWCDVCKGHRFVLTADGRAIAGLVEMVRTGEISAEGWVDFASVG